MKKIVKVALLCVAIAVSVLAGYIQGEREQAAEVYSKETGELVSIPEETEVPAVSVEEALETNPIRDLDDAYEIILNLCTKEFIGNHLIDENFLSWLYADYGEEVVENIATAVNNGYEDPELWYDLTGNSIHVLWLSYCDACGFPEDEGNIYRLECASQDQTVLDFSGDVNFAEGLATMAYLDQSPNGIRDCISEDLLQEMNQADLMMINNEFTYSTRGEPLPGKDYTFRADPGRVELLDTMGVDIVGLANNHVCDFGEEALIDTLETLENHGMPYVGAGRNLSEASEPAYFIMNGRKIAIVAATQIERSLNYTKEATGTSPGVLKTLVPDKYTAVIREASENSDVVIAFVHWGTEGNPHYGSDQAALAKAFVEAGADVIIGGHTHCLQGIAYVEEVPVIYSLGNFWFGSTANDGAAKKDTGLAQVVIERDGSIDFRFLPCVQENYRTSLVTENGERQRIFDSMESISSGIFFDENGYVTAVEE